MVLKGLLKKNLNSRQNPCLNTFIHVNSIEQNIKSRDRQRERKEAASDLAPINESNHCSSRGQSHSFISQAISGAAIMNVFYLSWRQCLTSSLMRTIPLTFRHLHSQLLIHSDAKCHLSVIRVSVSGMIGSKV